MEDMNNLALYIRSIQKRIKIIKQLIDDLGVTERDIGSCARRLSDDVNEASLIISKSTDCMAFDDMLSRMQNEWVAVSGAAEKQTEYCNKDWEDKEQRIHVTLEHNQWEFIDEKGEVYSPPLSEITDDKWCIWKQA